MLVSEQETFDCFHVTSYQNVWKMLVTNTATKYVQNYGLHHSLCHRLTVEH